VILRYEPWGAWVKLERTPAVVALSREGVRALGLPAGSSWDADSVPASPPLEVHLAVTSRCAAGCEGCYLDARANGEHVPREEIITALDAMRAAGVFTVAFGGGEPTSREDLGELAELARARDVTPVLTTSGLGLTPAKIERLRAFAQVNVSYDGPGEDYERVRGFNGARAAESAIAALSAAGIRVGVNVVLTRHTFDRFEQTLERAHSLGACEGQLLRYKPAGRAANLDYLARRLSAEQAASLGPRLRAWSAAHGDHFRVRIDCAMVPYLSADPEIYADPAALARFGVFGCEAGSSLAAVRTDGRVAPCSFAAPSQLRANDLAEGYAGDPTLTSFRSYADAPPEPCASCALRPVCKGGCKVVASHLGGAMGPDPECPRVRAHAAASACA
jgi:radical SAM protein with 4Fe4S-binding SPASM domain